MQKLIVCLRCGERFVTERVGGCINHAYQNETHTDDYVRGYNAALMEWVERRKEQVEARVKALKIKPKK